MHHHATETKLVETSSSVRRETAPPVEVPGM